MKVYLSGPMASVENHNYPLFNHLAGLWRAAGHEVLNPAEHFGGDPTHARNEYLRLDLEDLLEAEAIALLPGWEQSAGSKLELAAARELGLAVCDATRPGKLFVQLGLQEQVALLSFRQVSELIANAVKEEPPMCPEIVHREGYDEVFWDGLPVDTSDRQRSRFEELLDDMATLHRAKRSDYTGVSGDILHNYRTSARLAGIGMSTGIFARLCEKVVRISSIFAKGGDVKVKGETVADTVLDLAIISLLALIAVEQEGAEAAAS